MALRWEEPGRARVHCNSLALFAKYVSWCELYATFVGRKLTVPDTGSIAFECRRGLSQSSS